MKEVRKALWKFRERNNEGSGEDLTLPRREFVMLDVLLAGIRVNIRQIHFPRVTYSN